VKLTTLHARLTELVEAGYGDHHVIDDRGNDVRTVHPPHTKAVRRSEDSAVMLSLSIDHEGWNR
jgi:hypothetical protein